MKIPLLIKKLKLRTEELVQWLTVLTALPDNLSLIPSTHMTVHNHLQFQFQKI